MKKIHYLVILSIILFSTKVFSAQQEWISISSSSPEKCKPVLTTLSSNLSEVTFHLPGFFRDVKNTPQGNAYSITIPGGAKMLETGMPDMPQLTFSLIIPNASEMKAEIVSSVYTDYNFPVAPSKGNLKRDINPASVPYSYSSFYSVNAFYPTQLVTMREPYILRDFRGQTIVVNPFSYNPVTQTLRVYTTLTVRVLPSGNLSTKNSVSRQQPVSSVDPVFASVYQNHFLNFSSVYTPLHEHGNMLVIADASLMSTMQPFVNWKNRMGQPTEMVDIASVGTTATDIKTYIENYYNTKGLTFVLLVGDGPQIPTYPSSNGDSDPSYGYILGNDSYAEVIVGRFSANDPSELETQVRRTLDYEMNPDPNGQWYHKGVCIGSDQGPGDDNEMDFEHERNIRTDFMAYTYSDVDELYDGTEGGADAAGDPNSNDLNVALNDGRSVVTYTGHGSSTSLGTTGYGLSDISGLTNSNQLPFIWSVACVNGDFNSNTCLAEGLMRATSPTGEATGAIATFMSTINQSWDPPMDAQDEMVDLLVELYPGNIKHTFGGISVNGCMHMNDQYGTAGDEMTDTWTTFGDPSLMVRTNTPAPLTVTHTLTIDDAQTTFPVNCTMDGAQVCLSKDNQIISTGWTLLGTTSLASSGLNVGDTLDVVVTAYNAIPYYGQVIVTHTSTTGIKNISENSISLFPNPTNGKLTMTFPSDKKEISFKVVNSIGQTEMISHLNTDSKNLFDVDLTSLPAGLYSLVIFSNEGVLAVEKVVIKK